jgi:bifunctional DNA-binding transcriptional regulator/antitoxin component of YhaV-PrlF toxin-antitoxin module
MLAATVKVSGQRQVVIPRNIFDSLHWTDGMELTLITTESGIMLMPKTQKKNPAKSLRGCLQHKGKPIPTEQLCKPVEYKDDSI